MKMQFLVRWTSCSLQCNGSLTLGDLILLRLCYVFTDSKVFRKKFKSVLQNLQVMTTLKSQVGGKKSVGPGLQAGYAPVT